MEVKIRVGFRRSAPLSSGELEAIHRMGNRCAHLRWPGLSPIEIHALDGFGSWIASLCTTRRAPDPGLVHSPLLADQITALWVVIPGAEIVIDDPTRMLSIEGERLAFGGRDRPPDENLPSVWPDLRAVIPLPSPEPGASAEAIVPQLEALGSNLLQAVDQLERAQSTGARRNESDSLDEIVLTETPDAIPADLLDQAIQALYLDNLHPSLGTAGGSARFNGLIQDQLNGRARAATGAALLLARGTWSPKQVPGLIGILGSIAHRESLPWPLRALGVQAIRLAGRPDTPAQLQSLARSSTVQVARAAVRALGLIVDGDSRSLLRSMARIPALSAHAIAAMADIGDPVGCSIAEDLAEDPRDEVRLSVAHHLPRLGGARAAPILVRMQADSSQGIRREATTSLAEVCTPEELVVLLSQAEEDKVVAALQGIARSDRSAEAELVLGATADPRASIREAALDTLGVLGMSCATPAMLSCLEDPVSDVVLSAIQALSQCGDRRSRRPLESLSRRKGPIAVAAAHALRSGQLIDQPAPSARVNLRAWRREPLSDVERDRIQRFLEPTGLVYQTEARSFHATAEIQPRALARLARVLRAIQQIELGVIGLSWEVTDGQGIIRRAPGGWILSARRGRQVHELEHIEDPEPELAIDAPPPISILPSESLLDQETEIRVHQDSEDADAPTEMLSEPPPVRIHAIAVGDDEDEDEDEAQQTALDGIVLSIGATTSLDDDVGGIIEVQAAMDQADQDPGFTETKEVETTGAAFVYIEPPGSNESDAFQIHRPSQAQVKAYPHHAPMDDQVDVYEAAQDYQSVDQDSETGPWAALLSPESADEFLMDLVWAGLAQQDRQRIANWLRSPESTRVEAACRVIAATGEAVDDEALQKALRHGDPGPRAAAAHALGTLGGTETAQLLRQAEGDSDPRVREAVLAALRLLGEPLTLDSKP